MSFEELLDKAKENDPQAVLALFEMYRPLLISHSKIDGFFDPDTWQQQCEMFLIAIKKFDKTKIKDDRQGE